MYKLIAAMCLGAMAFSVSTVANAQNPRPATPVEAFFSALLGAPAATARRVPRREYYRPARSPQMQAVPDWGFAPNQGAQRYKPQRQAMAAPRFAPRAATVTRTNRAAKAAPAHGLDPRLARQTVAYQTDYKPGTIVIDTKARFLYLVQEGGQALRYGVGVGRPGFEWNGTVTIQRKAKWPTWTPPAAMRKREPWLPVRMEGGPDNPLGARAMYLYRNGKDTIYRIHGTNMASTIGKAVSSGCIRLLNEEIADLYERVPNGTKVVVI
ncbi:hypothetical protein MNBD_ALPHA09-1961 [hydrothermal vent metagenome]|uniref:L,D-TPase catalytic domain-containing protein n=1 Tax=hydrothermal vent metagenome TaxID=652676 RepID=A0A3B0TM52_9ZZZZ